jgi:putative tricarboxylic transport membrane protein
LQRHWKEAAVGLAFIAVSAVVYRDSLKLPPGNYDPLGGGTLPRIVCVTIIVLSLAVIAQAFVPVLRRAARQPATEALDYRQRPDLALLIFGLLILYTLAIQFGVPFAISTAIFLFLAMMVTGEFRRNLLLPAIVISVATAAALAYTFISVLKVDLP